MTQEAASEASSATGNRTSEPPPDVLVDLETPRTEVRRDGIQVAIPVQVTQVDGQGQIAQVVVLVQPQTPLTISQEDRQGTFDRIHTRKVHMPVSVEIAARQHPRIPARGDPIGLGERPVSVRQEGGHVAAQARTDDEIDETILVEISDGAAPLSISSVEGTPRAEESGSIVLEQRHVVAFARGGDQIGIPVILEVEKAKPPYACTSVQVLPMHEAA